MRIALTGSVAFDQLMTFPGRFAEQLLPEQLAQLSVVFLVDEMTMSRGGVAGNIAYDMSQLGARPLLVGAVGRDGEDYVADLATGGVDTGGVRVSAEQLTARFVCTTDRDLNQVAAFYPGAMSEAAEIELDAFGPLDIVVVSPNDPGAMLGHTAAARELGVMTIADPSQQIAALDGEALRALLDGPSMLFTNAYEARLLEHKTGWSAPEILEQVGTRVTTRGADGVLVERQGEPDLQVGVVPSAAPLDPTGVGDAFRAGWLAAHAAGQEMQRSVELGTLLATLCLEAAGPQGWTLADSQQRASALERLQAAHGSDSAKALAPLLQQNR